MDFPNFCLKSAFRVEAKAGDPSSVNPSFEKSLILLRMQTKCPPGSDRSIWVGISMPLCANAFKESG